MNFKAIKALSAKEFVEKRKELELELMKENAQIAVGTALKNPGMIREYKRTLARMKTLENQQ